MEKKKYPIGVENYKLYEEIGEGVSAKVHRALCIPLNELVAIKILDFERQNADLNSICREAQTMNLVDHPNLLKSNCSFVSGQYLWVVMPYMAGGSCLHILKAAFPDGFEEVVIATILREVLKGLDYLHQHGHIHRDVKAGNILIDSHGAIKLGDFGVSACLFDSGDRTRMRNTFVGTPCWMAPEVMEQLNGHDYRADIWSFGITGLELAHGHAPFSKYPPMKVLLMTLQNAPPGLDLERDRKFSKSFKQMIASCLVKDPSKRPSARNLMKHSFFKQAKNNEYISRKLMDGLPNLGERIKVLKKKEEDMLAQKKMLESEKEEISQNEYKRGISDWNFNLEDVKAQASLIIDDAACLSNISEFYEDQIDLTISYNRSTRSEKSDDDTSFTSSNHDQTGSLCCSPRVVDGNEETHQMELVRVASSNTMQHLHHRSSSGFSCSAESFLPPKAESKHPSTVLSFEVGIASSSTESVDTIPTASKSSTANNEESEDKSRVPVIQQKGRFKVTSGNVDLENVANVPLLHKSHSFQVITQHPISSHLPSSLDHPPPNATTPSVFSMLQSCLQANITQRENILTMMKVICSTEMAGEKHGGSIATELVALEKSMLQIAHDKEKDLLQEVTDLQWRLICTQEELQKLKTDSAHVSHAPTSTHHPTRPPHIN